MKGRGIEHRQQLRTGVARQPRRLFEPGVFANEQAHAHAFDLEHPDALAGREITALVKHLVVGQLAFVVVRQHGAAAQHAGTIVSPGDRDRARTLSTAGRMPHHDRKVIEVGQFTGDAA